MVRVRVCHKGMNYACINEAAEFWGVHCGDAAYMGGYGRAYGGISYAGSSDK